MPPERILLIRSGRHLLVATDALRARFPGCDIAVVGTAGTEQVIAHAGIAPGNTFIYSSRPRLTPAAFGASRAARAARRWGYTRVAVLWNDPDGRGQGNVDRTAFLLAPRGFIAITPDGSIVERSPLRQLGYEARRAAVSLATGVLLAALYLPAVCAAGAARLLRKGPAATTAHQSTDSTRDVQDSAGSLRDTLHSAGSLRETLHSAGSLRETRPTGEVGAHPLVGVNAKNEAA